MTGRPARGTAPECAKLELRAIGEWVLALWWVRGLPEGQGRAHGISARSHCMAGRGSQGVGTDEGVPGRGSGDFTGAIRSSSPDVPPNSDRSSDLRWGSDHACGGNQPMRLRVTLRQLIAYVAVIALLLALRSWMSTRHLPYGWWDLKPYFNVLYLPLVCWVLLFPQFSRSLARTVVVLSMVLVLLWLELERPYPTLLIGFFSTYPEEVIANWFQTDHLDNTRYAVHWFATCGALLDLPCLLVPLAIVPFLETGSTSRFVGALAVVLLCIFRIVDWATSGRVNGGGVSSWLWMDRAPIHVVRDWLAGQRTFHDIAEGITPLGVANVVIPLSVLVCLPLLLRRSPRKGENVTNKTQE